MNRHDSLYLGVAWPLSAAGSENPIASPVPPGLPLPPLSPGGPRAPIRPLSPTGRWAPTKEYPKNMWSERTSHLVAHCRVLRAAAITL